MAVQQDIILNFKANIDQAKTDLTSLASVFQQSMIPQGQPGALDDAQRGQVEQAITERATASGIPEAEVKKILQEVLLLEEEYKQKKAESATITERQVLLGQREVEATQKKNEALSNAASLLGLQKNASRDLIKQKLEELKLGKDSTLTDEERLAQIKEIEAQLQIASVQSGRLTKTYKEQANLHNQQVTINEKLNQVYGNIRDQLTKIAATDQERDLIEERLMPRLLEQQLQLQKNTKEREAAVAAAEKEQKETEEINAALRKAPDSFAKKAVSAVLYYEALNALKRVARAAITTLRDLDAALTDIAVVTNMNREESWALLETYQVMAKEVGLTASEVAKLSIEFFRQGREARDALELTATAAKFARIAAIDVKEAANFLTAAINGFNLAASEATTIIDKFAALGAGAAASAAEIAIALSKVAPAAASAGVEVDTLMAFITKGIETTREAPENIGTAFKTIFARMRQLTDIGKTLEDGMDVNKVDNALKNIGVSLRNANGEFRDLDDVLIDVGGKWDSITRNQQAYVATTLAGTRQQTRLIALFEDFGRTLELIELSQNSAGTAAIQHDEYLQGMAASTIRLRSSFQELVTSFSDADIIIAFINSLNTAVELLNTRVGRLIITIATLRLGFSSLTNQSGKLGKLIVGEDGKSGLFGALKQYSKSAFSGTKASQALGAAFSKLGGNPAPVKAIEGIGKFSLKGAGAVGTFKKSVMGLAGFITSPAGIILALLAIVVAIKNIRDSSDTTNIRVARLKVVFDRWARSLEKIFKVFKEKILPVLKNFVLALNPGLFLLNRLFKLTAEEEAAAGLRVLVNEVKDLNKELKESNAEADKLEKAIKTYQNLSNVGFKTSGQISQFEEAQQVLQDILGTTDTGDELTQQARAEFARQETLIKENYDLLNTKVEQYFKDNPLLSFQEALLDPAFDDELKAALPGLAQSYAQTLITGFENMTPEVQAAIARMVRLDPAAFLDATREIVTARTDLRPNAFGRDKADIKVGSNTYDFALEAGETLEEAFARADATFANFDMTLEEFFEKNKDLFEVTSTEIDSFYTDLVPRTQAALDAIFDADNAREFANAIMQAQEDIDFSSLTAEQVRLLERNFPNLATILDLPGASAQLQELFNQGGMTFVRNFNAVRSEVLGLSQALAQAYASPYSQPGDGERFANLVVEDLFNILSSGEIEDTAAEAINKVFRGAVGGIVIPESERVAVANAILSMIPTIDSDAMRTSVFGFVDDFKSISELAGKSINEFTKKDLELLAKYPDALNDIKNGQFDINAFKAQESDIILENLERQREVATLNRQTDIEAINLQRRLGEITRQQAAERIAAVENLFNAQINEIEILEEVLAVQATITDTVADRYKAQLDAIKAQKDAIKQAQDIRKLQEDSANIARRSLEATRVGAVGTLEARFNQQQLGQEIAAMNRQMQDQIMLAQLEAQQKVLEDSQQQAIQAATEANTTATEQNTNAIQTLTETTIRNDPALDSAMRTAVTGRVQQPFDLDLSIQLAE